MHNDAESNPRDDDAARECCWCAGCGLLVGVLLFFGGFFGVFCWLLYEAHTPAVRSECGGFWDFMLVSLLSPLIFPLAYLLLGCGLVSSWGTFMGIAYGALGVTSLIMTINAASNGKCVEAIRATVPPEPWLLLIGWLKAIGGGFAATRALAALQRDSRYAYY